MSNKDFEKKDRDHATVNCEIPLDIEEQFEPVKPRIARGNAPVLIEIICERVHCVLYDYAINTVDMIVEIYGDEVDIQTVIRRGDSGNAEHYLDLCKRAGKMLAVPAILINGEVAFDSVPHPDDLIKAIEGVLERQK
ncbi:MAG: hypothetical protein WBB19_04990 [Desulforhopalus sp.]